MGLADDLRQDVGGIFSSAWTERDGVKVPESIDLKLTNDAVKLDGTVLYADLSGSTALVDKYKPTFAAKIYKAFLHCAAKLIQNEGGVITAYDGDRIMAVFVGTSKNTSAAKAALRINWARTQVINPAIKKSWPNESFQVQLTTGVDTSPLFIARTGVRGNNDLVWIGRAANHAAKLTELPHDYPSRITKEVYDVMNEEAKTAKDGQSMWEQVAWNTTGRTIYRSTWHWGP
jgi:uridylate cyclase